MSGSRSSNDPEHKSPRESGEDSEDESEILEESPCGRWLKRREEPEPSKTIVYNLVKKFHTTESVLDKKGTCVKRVLTEMLDEIGHRIERSPTSFRRVAQQDFDWRNFIVSNSNDSTALVYCMNGHRYDERFVRRIINKSGCVRVACWGWMSYDGAGLLERIHERFTAEVYEHILANVMIPSVRKRYPEGTLFFQQDTHPIQTANRIQRWFTRRRDVDPVD
ncbi:hypothetical protein ANN_19091 [Periplaneta americana]|uniref:Uncharacterized protein n=1 Tax=Periplaneta americana TaxID=6978 RepID=A0ABQ8SRA4_PERAM|nr:hypothetical protein ANN_19091 [Periplaneta americana]